jgi:hypothetical protein
MIRFRRKREPEKSNEALAEATEQLRIVKARTPEVKAVSTALRAMRERNHFAETLQVIIEGHK